jgi:hypothetical protein
VATEFSNAAVKKTFTAGADLSGAQYKFVKIDPADGDVVVADATTDRPVGVLQNDPEAGQAAEVTITGGSKLVAGGSASAGEPLFTSASATGVTATYGEAASAMFVTGAFLEDAAAGEIVSVVVNCANLARGV